MILFINNRRTWRGSYRKAYVILDLNISLRQLNDIMYDIDALSLLVKNYDFALTIKEPEFIKLGTIFSAYVKKINSSSEVDKLKKEINYVQKNYKKLNTLYNDVLLNLPKRYYTRLGTKRVFGDFGNGMIKETPTNVIFPSFCIVESLKCFILLNGYTGQRGTLDLYDVICEYKKLVKITDITPEKTMVTFKYEGTTYEIQRRLKHETILL